MFQVFRHPQRQLRRTFQQTMHNHTSFNEIESGEMIFAPIHDNLQEQSTHHDRLEEEETKDTMSDVIFTTTSQSRFVPASRVIDIDASECRHLFSSTTKQFKYRALWSIPFYFLRAYFAKTMDRSVFVRRIVCCVAAALSFPIQNHAFRSSVGRHRKLTGESFATKTVLSMVQQKQPYQHALAILSMPECSMDRIANEAIVESILPETQKLSVVLRCQNGVTPSTAALRRTVGEIYSQLWDVALSADGSSRVQNPDLPDVVVYPQNLPNAAPESWIDIAPDLDCICSHDFTVGWTSETATNEARGKRFERMSGNGIGGLDEHVANVNRERQQRNLKPVQAFHIENFEVFEKAVASNHVTFLDDEEDECVDEGESIGCFLSGAVPYQHVYNAVCCGGTFDGLHFGHRKLLTLAVSSVTPVTGSLLVGVTVDEMLRKKAFYEQIPSFAERCNGVRQFLYRLAPGMINRIQVVPITDAFGPPGQKATAAGFDALVLSHETLKTGYLLNEHRVNELHLPPLQLLCTRRTESHGMSSTALRRLRLQRLQAGSTVISPS
jgi:phosphopantetheine adenylyltransferase